MNIADYLNEIEYASTHLLGILWDERNRFGQLEADMEKLAPVVEDNYRRAEAWQSNADGPDDVMTGAGIYCDNYFNEDKKLYYKDQDCQALVNRMATHSFSVTCLAGDLLQHAKQGISLAYGHLANCPDGRAIGSQALNVIIWQGRNQANHWEDGNFHSPTKACFNTLAQEIDPKFFDYTIRNMAFEVVELLGWKTFNEFSTDMLSLA